MKSTRDLTFNLLARIWKFLTEPFELLQRSDRRLAIFSAVLLLISAIGVFVEQRIGGATPVISLILLMAGYLTSRTRWFRLAAFILLVTLSFPSYRVALTTTSLTTTTLNNTFIWLVLPIIISSLIFPIHMTVVFSFINIGLLVCLPVLRPSITFAMISQSLEYLTIVTVFIVIVMIQRNRLENDRQAELIQSQADLKEEVLRREQFAEQAQRRADQLVTLVEINSAVSSLQGLGFIFNTIYEQARRQFKPDVFYIATYNEQSGLVSFPIMYDMEKIWDQPQTPLENATRIKAVIETKKPFLLNRTQDEVNESLAKEYRLGDQSKAAASVIITPLLMGTETVGAISIQSYTPNIYTDDDLAMLTAIAQQASIAIENTRLYEQTTKKAEQFAIINKIGREISTLSNLPTLMENVYKQIQLAFSPDLFFITLVDWDTETINFPFTYDNGKQREQSTQPMSRLENTFTGQVIRDRKPLLISEWSNSGQINQSDPVITGDDGTMTKSLMYAPLVGNGATLGIVSVQNYQPHVYNDEDLSLLSGIANQFAISIQNARLLDESKQNERHLSILNEVARVVTELKDLPTLLEIIYLQVKKHLKTDAFFVDLYIPETNKVSHPITYDNGIRYTPQSEELAPDTFLYDFLQGKPALLELRTAEDLSQSTQKENLFGDTQKRSASIMAAPMKVGNKVIGAISTQSYTLNAYTENDLNLLIGISSQIGIAIQNARLLGEIQQNSAHLTTINELGRIVSELRDLPSLLEIIYKHIKKIMLVDAFFVGLHQQETNRVVYPIMYDNGRKFEVESDELTPHSYLYGFMHGGPSLLLLRTREELAPDPNMQGMIGDTNKKSASLIMVPLKVGKKIIGVISVQSYTLSAYDPSSLKLLEGIANQVSIAIENSRLYTEAQNEIRERQKAEEQLREAETQYRELVEHVPGVIYSAETGESGQWFYVSPQIQSLLGFTPKEWLENPQIWAEHILSQDRTQTIATENQLVEEGSSLELEYRMKTRDGQIIWVHDESLNVSFSQNGKYVVQGILTDITARKQAEITLKESELKFQALFLRAERQTRELSLLGEIQNVLAKEIELSELIKTVVSAIADVFGYKYISIYLLDLNQLQLQYQVGYPKESVIERISPNEGISGKVIRTGRSVLIEDVATETEFLRASADVLSEICVPLFDGKTICGILNVESAKDQQLGEDDLRIVTILSNQVNIGIRRARLYADRADGLLREQRVNEIAHAINSSLELPVILKTAAHLTAELIGADTGNIAIMSYDGEEMVDVFSYLEDPQLTLKIQKGHGLTWETYERGSSIVLDSYSSHPNAMPEWSNLGLQAFMSVPIKQGNNPIGVFSLYNKTSSKKFTQRDLSTVEAISHEVAVAIENARLFDALHKELDEHKHTQKQLKEIVQELESKNAELERFTYTVSHDLKSPLVTIGGFIGYLDEDFRRERFERIPNTINRIREAAKRMQRLLDELLELSRIGRIANPSSNIPFGELVRETLEMLDGQLKEKQVEVKVDADLPSVYVDRVRIIEVIQNLIANAIKFTGEQKNPMIHIGAETKNGAQIFFVKDNGTGIAPEFHERIFGLFNKLDQHSEGTGIGLALVKRIIEVHGGKIWVESELGKGATFFFTLANKNTEETA